jgi:hypothetical protein
LKGYILTFLTVLFTKVDFIQFLFFWFKSKALKMDFVQSTGIFFKKKSLAVNGYKATDQKPHPFASPLLEKRRGEGSERCLSNWLLLN